MLGPLAFAALVWGSLAAVVVVFALLLRAARPAGDASTSHAEVEP